MINKQQETMKSSLQPRRLLSYYNTVIVRKLYVKKMFSQVQSGLLIGQISDG